MILPQTKQVKTHIYYLTGSVGQESGHGLIGSSIRLHGFPGGSVVKNLPANAGNACSITGSGRSPGGEHSILFQYFIAYFNILA